MIQYMSQSVTDSLQQLISKGYQLAELNDIVRNEENLPNDWRLDSVKHVRHEQNANLLSIIIAVSSGSRDTKLIFVESAAQNRKIDFSPMSVMRRLFPKT
jgi:hypothetical protein